MKSITYVVMDVHTKNFTLCCCSVEDDCYFAEIKPDCFIGIKKHTAVRSNVSSAPRPWVPFLVYSDAILRQIIMLLSHSDLWYTDLRRDFSYRKPVYSVAYFFRFGTWIFFANV